MHAVNPGHGPVPYHSEDGTLALTLSAVADFNSLRYVGAIA